MDDREIMKVEKYLRNKFENADIRVMARADGSAEVYIGDKKFGGLTVDEEEGDRSYNWGAKIKIKPESKLE